MTTEPTTLPTAMRAITQQHYGADPRQTLTPATVSVPEPATGELLVRVEAAGVDRGAWHLVLGHPLMIRPVYGVRRPKRRIPGGEFAGVVAAVGPDVTSFQPGDRVYGTGDGAFAEFVAVPAKRCALAPRRLDPTQAAACPISGTTALQAVRDQAAVQPGDRVLVLGASGGVGTFAVQIALAFGAEVTGTARTDKLDVVRALGAHRVIDHRTTDPLADSAPYDVILDIGGNRSVRAMCRALTRHGRLVIIGGETSGRLFGGFQRQLWAMAMAPFVSQQVRVFVAKDSGDELAALAGLIDDGKVTPVVGGTAPLTDAGTVLHQIGAGSARGKYVLLP